jgi:hypothetical protein
MLEGYTYEHYRAIYEARGGMVIRFQMATAVPLLPPAEFEKRLARYCELEVTQEEWGQAEAESNAWEMLYLMGDIFLDEYNKFVWLRGRLPSGT